MDEIKKRLEEIYQTLLHDEKILKMKEVPMHRGSNCYMHSFKVAKIAVHRALHRKKADPEVVLYASILHDYYLYDWRKDRSKLKHHGSRHPFIAAEHAKRDFDVSEKIQEVMRSHMWPLNIKEFPKSREAKLLSYADKKVAIKEALCSKRYKEKHWDKYEEHISHLFDK